MLIQVQPELLRAADTQDAVSGTDVDSDLRMGQGRGCTGEQGCWPRPEGPFPQQRPWDLPSGPHQLRNPATAPPSLPLRAPHRAGLRRVHLAGGRHACGRGHHAPKGHLVAGRRGRGRPVQPGAQRVGKWLLHCERAAPGRPQPLLHASTQVKEGSAGGGGEGIHVLRGLESPDVAGIQALEGMDGARIVLGFGFGVREACRTRSAALETRVPPAGGWPLFCPGGVIRRAGMPVQCRRLQRRWAGPTPASWSRGWA